MTVPLLAACGGPLGLWGINQPVTKVTTTTVTVQVEGVPATAQSVAVSGSTTDLGAWDATKAITLTATGNNSWTGSVSMPPGESVQLKFTLTDGSGAASFEPGNNRQWTVPSAPNASYLGTWGQTQPGAVGTHALQTVFLILMENHNWSSISGSASAPYINNTLLPMASHAEQYFNPPGNHPSEPNYLWLEAGTNFGVTDDSPPSANHQSTTQHLTTLLQSAGITWKSYEEGIDGTSCPLTASGLFAPKHDAPLFFDDVTNSLDPSSPNCIAHIRPYSELASDIQNNTVPRYVFITPNLCDDMHNNKGCASSDSVANGDTWLSTELPKIMASAAYQNGGAVFVTWDESEGGDFPIGMISVSPLAKGNGYSNTLAYTHSSTLRTLEEIFGVSPMLGDAANATDLSDFFQKFP